MHSAPKVRNQRNGTPGAAIYIGRGSRWGNPFHIGQHGGRETVVEAYFEYLKTRPDLITALETLRGFDLLCYCAPLLCHGDVLLLLANATPEERWEYLSMSYVELGLF